MLSRGRSTNGGGGHAGAEEWTGRVAGGGGPL